MAANMRDSDWRDLKSAQCGFESHWGHVKKEPGLSRNTKVLWTLIAMATVALVISAAILMMLNGPGDFSTVPKITKATSSSSSAVSASSTTPSETPTSSETSTTESSDAPVEPEPSSASRVATPSPRGTVSFHPTPGVG